MTAWLGEGAPVVTVTGAFGMGKSRVAMHVADAIARGGDERVQCIALEDIGAARAFDRAARGTRASPAGADPALVVFDNADRVIGHVASFVAQSRRERTPLRFIVTSREPLDIEGERVIRLGPLSIEDARAMFVALAEGGPWDANLDDLLVRLGGVPLAIELAAGRAGVLPPRELVARAGELDRLLKSARRDAPRRHATIDAAIEWSWSRLSPDERRGWAGLALFERAAPLEAFEAVVGPMLEGDPVDVAQALARKSIARLDATGPARLLLPPMAHAFGRRRAAEATTPEEWRAAVDRHARAFVQRAERAAGYAYGPDGAASLDAIERDRADLLSAAERTQAPDVTARIAVALSDLALVRGAIDLRSPLFVRGVEAADEAKDAVLRVRARVALARVLLERGRASEAEALAFDASRLAASAGLEDAEGDALRSLGWAELALGKAAEAAASFDRALSRHTASGARRGQADALAARGLARGLQGDAAQGHRDLEGAHAIHVVSADAIRRAKVVEMGRLVGLNLDGPEEAEEPPARAARLQASAEAHRAADRPWRQALSLFEWAAIEGSPEKRRAALAAARAAATAGGVSDAVLRSLESSAEAPAPGPGGEARWVVARDARTLTLPDGQTIDLARHGSLRRVLEALVARRLDAPGQAMTALALLEAGWPGERVRFESGMLRVYTAVRRLRAMGLGRALLTRDDGYLLGADALVERRNE